MSEPSTITTNLQAYRDGTLSQPSVIRRNPNEDHRAAQPSAPTADVEKKCGCPDPFSFGHEPGCALLVEAKAIRQITEAAWQDVRERIISYDSFEAALRPHFELVRAQARAPLVKVLKYYRDEYTGFEPSVSVLDRMVDEVLTGTEISRVKEGEVTTK